MDYNGLDQLLAEECGLDHDKGFIYQCSHCDEQSSLNKFEDTECDGDVWGRCPKCGEYVMIFEVISEEMYI